MDGGGGTGGFLVGLALGMNRSILLSLTTIGAVVGLFASAATFAAFTSSDTESGSVTAGTVAINAQGDVTGTATNGLSFDPGAAGCPLALAPGNTCTETVHVKNVGSLPVTVSFAGPPTVTNFETVGTGVTMPDCTAGDWITTGTLAATAVAPGAEVTFPVTIQLHPSANNGCQGESPLVSVTVTASNP